MTNKIVFWIDAFLLPYCIAYYLQKIDPDCEIYAVVDLTPKPKKFFDKQSLVQFKKIWYYHDKITTNATLDLSYLTHFEKKYNIDLWKLAINERLFYRFNNFHKFNDKEIQIILEQECKLFESILDEIKPDFLIGQKPNYHHSELFYELCLKKGVIPILITQSRIAYHSILCQDAQKLDSSPLFNEIKSNNRSLSELRDFLKSVNVSKQLIDYKNNLSNSNYGKLKAFMDFALFSDNEHSKTYYTYFGRRKSKVLSHTIQSIIRKKIRQRFIDKTLLKDINMNEKFVYFPLAMDEERNLLIGAPYYTNQIEIIRIIAKSLPVDYKLYVKEHYSVAIRDWRQISDYKEIMEIPNVRLFHPSVPNELFLKNCGLVVTIAGTSAFEAAFYEKPSIIFSDTNYSVLPSVHKIKSIEELPMAIRKSLQTKVNSDDLDKFLTILEKDSINFDLYGFITKMDNSFYYGGNLVNVEITEEQMISFLRNNENVLRDLISEYIKKMKHYKSRHE